MRCRWQRPGSGLDVTARDAFMRHESSPSQIRLLWIRSGFGAARRGVVVGSSGSAGSQHSLPTTVASDSHYSLSLSKVYFSKALDLKRSGRRFSADFLGQSQPTE